MASVNGVEICYERLGPRDGVPLLLIMGLRAQLIDWDEGFCSLLAQHGFSVVRFDNRDAGLSTKTEGPPPTLGTGGWGLRAGGAPPPYTLDDMAADALGVLDTVGIERAHVVGASLGGMIAQHMAFGHADRVLTLTSIMSTTGNLGVGGPTLDALTALVTPPPQERDAAIEHGVGVSRVISGPLWDERRARERAAERYDRCFHPAGTAFQLAAAIADGDRTRRLRAIRCPTLVIHGRVDPLVDVSGGEAAAAAIPGAELLVLEEMGHDLPKPLWPRIVEAIADVAARADG
jgi:pimeloyl-ACP methyl ester carboxylesterase